MPERVSCDKIWDLLSEYADGVASPEDARLVEDHIAHCESCASALRFLRETAQLLSSPSDIEPPDGLREAIFRVAAGTNGKPIRRRRPVLPMLLRGTALAASGAAAVMVLAYLAVPRIPVPRLAAGPSTVRPMRADAHPGSETGGDVAAVNIPLPSPYLAPSASGVARSSTPKLVMASARKLRPGLTRSVKPSVSAVTPAMMSDAIGKEPGASESTSAARARADAALSVTERLLRLASAVGSAVPDERTAAKPIPTQSHLAPVATGPARQTKAAGTVVRLVAGSVPSPSTVATIADLRSELRSAQADTLPRLDESVRRDRGTLSVDLVRSRF